MNEKTDLIDSLPRDLQVHLLKTMLHSAPPEEMKALKQKLRLARNPWSEEAKPV